MEGIPAPLITALSSDLKQACGFSYEELLSMPGIPPDADYSMAAASSLAHSFAKKIIPREHGRQDEACYAKFLTTNSRSEMWQLCLNTSGDEVLWGTFKRILWDFFHPKGLPIASSLDELFLKGRVGPGAAIGALNGDFYSKLFGSPLTSGSRGLVQHYQSYIQSYLEWSIAESVRAQSHSEVRIVQSSRLSFVAKNATISRSICVEPGLNMFYQLGLGAILTERLDRFFRIDLSRQPDRNGHYALIGSVDDSWSTLDLESASDSVSLALCKEVLPSYMYDMLTFLRSPSVTYKGKTHKLFMMSTMGNGFTFPLQTALFAAMAVASMTICGLPNESPAVFGDDICIPSRAVSTMRRLLSLAGFVVNEAKSFDKGPFRESCGFDYFRGGNVRGVYVKRLHTLQDSYALINALNGFSARTGVVLSGVMNRLVRSVDRAIEIPLWEDPSGGIRLPKSMIKSRRTSKTTYGTIYQTYCFKPRKLQIVENRMFTRKGEILYNSPGLVVAAVSGMLSSSGLPLRDQGRWKKERRSCSYWDSFESASGFFAGATLGQIETAAYLNLFD